jgi:uncharacterized protein (DUF111 family)
LAVLVTNSESGLKIKIEKTAYGVGQKDNQSVPNLLRVFLGETEPNSVSGHEALHLECNIDDMNPEFFEFISDKLFDAGASDVFLSNIIMKKGRPGIVLNVICETGAADSVKNIIFTESTSLGIRSFQFKKDTLVRKFDAINTIYGVVKVKRSFFREKEVSFKPEYEDCKRIASEKNIPIKEVYNNIIAELVRGRS